MPVGSPFVTFQQLFNRALLKESGGRLRRLAVQVQPGFGLFDDVIYVEARAVHWVIRVPELNDANLKNRSVLNCSTLSTTTKAF